MLTKDLTKQARAKIDVNRPDVFGNVTGGGYIIYPACNELFYDSNPAGWLSSSKNKEVDFIYCNDGYVGYSHNSTINMYNLFKRDDVMISIKGKLVKGTVYSISNNIVTVRVDKFHVTKRSIVDCYKIC